MRGLGSIASSRSSTPSLRDRAYIVGPLSVVDFLIGPRLDTGPAYLKFDISRYQNINAWLERLRAKPYWQDA